MATHDAGQRQVSAMEPVPPLHNLPVPPTPLIGRFQETAAAVQRLRDDAVHVLTLIGPPGIGKTRLAIAIAAALRADFAHGVCFVDLSPVRDAGLVLPAIAGSLGLRPAGEGPLLAELQAYLRPRPMLLVLDNFEQVLPAAEALADMVHRAQQLKLLVTSRELLRIAGEHTFPVPPLPLPPLLTDRGPPRTLTSPLPEWLGAYDAVRLFVQRAAAVQPTFALTAENAVTVAGICCRLDGLPLAIELAAARVRHLPPHAMYERLDRRLQILTGGVRDLPPRQRTLRAAVAWSYELLDHDERRLLLRLAVFRGGCSLHAVEVVCGQGLTLEPLNVIASLVDKSLLQQTEPAGGEARYRMLEVIHEYAREQLESGDEAQAVRRRHASYYAGLTDRAEHELRGASQRAWFQLVELELDNFRAALGWSLEQGEIAVGIRITCGIQQCWHISGRLDEGIGWTRQLLARMDVTPLADQIRLLRSATQLISYRDAAAAEQLGRRALALARDAGDPSQLAWVLLSVGAFGPSSQGEAELAPLLEAEALFRAMGDRPGLASALNSLGEHARLAGDHERARRSYREALAILEQLGDTRGQYAVLYNLGLAAQAAGEHHEALGLLRQSLAFCQEVGVPAEVARELLAIGGSLGATGEPTQAARLMSAALAFLQRSGAVVDPNDQPQHDRNMALVRARLGEEAYAQAWAEGQQMTLDQALAAVHARSRAQPALQPDALTRREREVARLVAAGRSNRAIAEALVITERTVEGHVSNILGKLGFTSRAQIAAWVAGGRAER